MRKKLLMGNWKMNGSVMDAQILLEPLRAHLGAFDDVDVVVFPPFPYIPVVAQALGASLLNIGGQDVSAYPSGAYTGEVSAKMLLDVGCEFVLLGHSERRQYHGESDALLAKKLHQALEVGLIPVLCVGETLLDREAGRTIEVIRAQLEGVLGGFDEKQLTHLVIAYEPVWAIGTGKTATPAQVEEVHAAIREMMEIFSKSLAKNMRIVYGGSVKLSNAREIFDMANVDGALVGGASLNAQEFIGICEMLRCEMSRSVECSK